MGCLGLICIIIHVDSSIPVLGLIKESCPRFFEMHELITECPNVVPAGIGNSKSEINMDSLVMGDDGETQNEQTSTDMLGNFDVDVDEDNLEDDDGLGKGTTKLTNKLVTETSRKTGTRPGTSKPATHTPKEWTKKRKVTDFVELAGAEEMTRQKELEVAKARAEVDKAKLEARKAETAYKTQKLADKAAKRKERADEKAMKLQLLVEIFPPPGHTGVWCSGNTPSSALCNEESCGSIPSASDSFYENSNT